MQAPNITETITYHNNWVVNINSNNQYYNTITSYRLEPYSRYYSDVNSDDYFVVDEITLTTDYRTGNESYEKKHIFIKDTNSYQVFIQTNDKTEAHVVNGKPPLAYKK